MEARASNENSRPCPWGSFCGLVRRLAWVALTVVALAASAVVFLGHQVDEQIRQHIERDVAGRCPGLTVRIRSARRVTGGIEIRGLTITGADDEEAVLLTVDEIMATCPNGVKDLLVGSPPVRHLVLRRPVLRLTRRADGSWNGMELLKTSPDGRHPPIVTVIESGSLEVRDASHLAVEPLKLQGIDFQIGPTSDWGEAAQSLQFGGIIRGEHFRQVTVSGQWDPRQLRWWARGEVTDLALSSHLLARLPGELGTHFQPLATLRARAQLKFQVQNGAQSDSVPRFVISGNLTDGRFDDERLPYPLIDLHAAVHCDNRGLKIENLRARSGRTRLELSLVSSGFTEDCAYQLRAKASRLSLDRRLYDALPPRMQAVWQNYSPSGVVDIELTLDFDGRRFTPDVQVRCSDIAFVAASFPYPMNQGSGTLHWRGQVLSTEDFQARAAGQVMRFRSRVEDPGPNWTGWVEAVADGPIPIDEQLLDAIERVGTPVLRSLRPSGLVTLTEARLTRRAGDERPRLELDANLDKGAVQYEKFAYPINDISGQLLLREGVWSFRNLSGRNDSGFISCQGSWTGRNGLGGSLQLEFDCRAIPLEDELRDALPFSSRQMWYQLRPRGTLDQLQVTLEYDARLDDLSLDVRALKWPPEQNVEGRSITLHPIHFPYRMDNVTGSMRIRDGIVEIQKMRADHGRSRIKLAGRCQADGGGWTLNLSELTADNLRVDHELMGALPPELAKALQGVNFVGTLNMYGPRTTGGKTGPALRLQGLGRHGGPVTATWDLGFDIENGSINSGARIEHIHGGFTLVGVHDEHGPRSRGEIEVDSLIYQGAQLTQVRGPLWIDQSRLLLGSWAAPQNDANARPVIGKVFGGTASGDARLSLAGDGAFQLRGLLTGGDLAKIVGATTGPQHKVSGRVYARLSSLSGKMGQTHTYQGQGAVRLTNADIYELPVMVALLKLLSVRQPDKTAFTSSEIDFRLQGEHLYFDPINFKGDAVSLIGKGWMDLRRQIQLTFYTQVGRNDWSIPLLSSVLAEASRNILEIEVVGTLDNPVVNRTAFPEVDETLQRILGDKPASRSAAKGVFPRGARRSDHFVPQSNMTEGSR